MVLHRNSPVEATIYNGHKVNLWFLKCWLSLDAQTTSNKNNRGCLDLTWLAVCYILISLFSAPYIRTLLHNYAVIGLHNEKNNQHKKFNNEKLGHKKTLIKLWELHAYHLSPNQYICVSTHRQCLCYQYLLWVMGWGWQRKQDKDTGRIYLSSTTLCWPNEATMNVVRCIETQYLQ